MKKNILITTSMERATRILLRTELFELFKQEYDIIIASTAEVSDKWREEFKDVTFFSDIAIDGSIKGIKDTIENSSISAIISCSNSDVPAHTFDVNFQKIGRQLGIPIIIVQDFIDAIFHPQVITPDLYLCWGSFFQRIFSRKRDVMFWHPIGSLDGLGVEEPLPNGEMSQWVFETYRNFMETAKEFGGQVIIKTHPIRNGDSWMYNLISQQFPTVKVQMIKDPSLHKGLAYGVKEYDGNMYHLDSMDVWSLGNTLFNSDIVCSIPSTSALEAMIFNKPVVLETQYWSHPWEVRRNVMSYYWNVLEAYKCCKRSKKYGELFQYVEQSLKNPNELQEGRANLIRDFFNGVDGNACKNIFNEIKGFLG